MGSSVQGAAVNFKKLSTLIRFSLKVTKILKPESTKPYNSEILKTLHALRLLAGPGIPVHLLGSDQKASGLWLQGLGLRVLGFRVWGFGFGV